MAKGGLRVKIESESYEINFDKVTLGEAVVLNERFGLQSLRDFNIFDPKQLVGVLYLMVKRGHPELDEDEIMAKVDAVETGPIFDALTKQVEQARQEAAAAAVDPPKAAAKGSRAAAARNSGTTRKRTGNPSTSASTA
jgi:hypothetical protein